MGCLLRSGMPCFGTSCMLIAYAKHNWKISVCICDKLHKAHEATLVFKKSFWGEQKFAGEWAEGQAFLIGREKQIFQGDIALIMVCLAHGSNTVNKLKWLKNKIPLKFYPDIQAHKTIFETLDR